MTCYTEGQICRPLEKSWSSNRVSRVVSIPRCFLLKTQFVFNVVKKLRFWWKPQWILKSCLPFGRNIHSHCNFGFVIVWINNNVVRPQHSSEVVNNLALKLEFTHQMRSLRQQNCSLCQDSLFVYPSWVVAVLYHLCTKFSGVSGQLTDSGSWGRTFAALKIIFWYADIWHNIHIFARGKNLACGLI